jgi:protease-4
MRSVRSFVVCALAATVAAPACSSQSNRLDPAAEHEHGSGASNDPWASSAGGHKKKAGDDDKGFDLQGAYEKIKHSVETPGPYDAPEHSADYDDSKPHWGVMRLHGAVVEREAFSWTGGSGTELRELAHRLTELANDAQLVGLTLRVDQLEVSVPDAVELRSALHAFRKAGKQLRCHVENASNTTYLVVTACDAIGLAPLGDIAITGPAAMPIHVKGLLDKLGITADFIHIGAYKGAAEPLTRDAPSPEMQETLGAILDQRFSTMVDVIASDRKLDPLAVKALIDTGMFQSDDAKVAKLVDAVQPFEAFRDAPGQPWTKLDLAAKHADALSSWVKLARFVGAMPADRPLGDHVALVYALGEIQDGRGDGLLGARAQIAAETMIPALRAIAANDSVKAVVLRVDSPGGSAQASELIWHAIAELRAKKPVIVSMSDVAASGGYYISSGATKIFAMPDTLTGSIGVIGGKLAIAGALAKVGVTMFPTGRGKHATMWTGLSAWTDDEEGLVRALMQRVYDQFVARVAEGRHKPTEAVQAIAQGRVWTGTKAKELGLVDELGGLDEAIAEAKRAAKLPADSDLEVYPPTPTLRDLLASFGQVSAPLGLGSHAALAEISTLDPALAVAAENLLTLLLSFRATTVQTLAFLPVLN